jgi:hypothetical protein
VINDGLTTALWTAKLSLVRLARIWSSLGRRTPGLLIAAMVPACGASAYDRCRIGAGFQQDPIARELALNRCEQVANREYVERVRREEMRREDAAQVERANETIRTHELRMARERDARNRDVREHPRAVEIGATPRESAALCERQGGYHRGSREPDGTIRFTCTVGAAPIYVALVRNMEAVFAVKVFYENGDLPSTRRRLESQLGPAERSLTEQGYRVWLWESTNPQVDLRSYESGVAVTIREAEP